MCTISITIGWRQSASSGCWDEAGSSSCGLANAWQYFFMLSLISAKEDGIVALVIPYEWVSRPSAKAIRDYISSHGWSVTVIVSSMNHSIEFSRHLRSLSWTKHTRMAHGLISNNRLTVRSCLYQCDNQLGQAGELLQSAVKKRRSTIRAKRGLSPGTQKVLTLSDGERARLGLRVDVDVVPCVTLLKHLPVGEARLDGATFEKFYVKDDQVLVVPNRAALPQRGCRHTWTQDPRRSQYCNMRFS